MKSTILIISMLAILSGSECFADPIGQAKAIEQACHRIERLVILKRVDAAFETGAYQLSVQKFSQAAPADPYFKVIALQRPGADGKVSELDLLMDDQGKTLSSSVIAVSPAENTPAWTGVDAITLIENALHYVLDQNSVIAELQPYFRSMTDLTLTQILDASGNPEALVEMRASEVTGVLRMKIKVDGTFDSYLISSASFSGLTPEFTSIRSHIFEPRCFQCHHDGGAASRVPLQTRVDLLNSPRDLVLPGNPEESGLIIAVTRSGAKRMPPPSSGEQALSDEEIGVLKQWIQNGAL
ncbi:MAG: c-type cytochrome domain-containing protein [Bdellovibrionota bacterium]